MNCITYVLPISLLVVFAQSFSSNEWNLELVQILFRNGISAPEALYPNDPNHPNSWEEGLGQLTLDGQKQLYSLGKDLKKRYSHFLSSNPLELTVQSTFLDKCMDSALCLLASLYEPDEDWEFIPGLKWQPIPISYEPFHKDKILRSVAELSNINPKLLSGAEVELDNFKNQMKYWTLFSGMTVNDFFQISKLQKILFAEHISNRTIPDWAWKYWKELQILKDSLYKLAFTDSNTLRNVGGPLLFQMVQNAVNKSQDESNYKKIFIYSGQSAHVAGVLGALKCFNSKEPPFAAALLMEMLKKKNQNNETEPEYGIRLSYFNKTNYQIQVEEPKILIIPGCTEICPLQNLENLARQFEIPFEEF